MKWLQRLWLAFPLASVLAAGSPPAPMEVYFTPYSHLDLFWGGTREECLARGNRIIAKAIRQAAQSPEFRFLIEDEVFLANYVDTHQGTAELAELRRLVRDGRVEISPKWAAVFQGLPPGEVHVRNLVIGKRYARSTFGVDPQMAHLGDLPDYTKQLPQLLASAGVPYMIMTRMGPKDKSLFRWRAPDGSSTLVWNALKDYGQWVFMRRGAGAEEVERVRQQLEFIRPTWTGPWFVHWGVDLWTTPDNLVDIVHQLNGAQSFSRFQFATPSEFFKRVSASPSIPELSGEIPSSWPNIATSLPHIWPMAEPSTNTLLNAEKFAAINYGLGYADYPGARFERLWKLLIESMDHNHDGQGGAIGDNRKIGYMQMAQLEGGEILRDMLRNIAERVQIPAAERSHPIVVFNPQNWQRDDLVNAHVTLYGDVMAGDLGDYRKGMRLVDEQGHSVPFIVPDYRENISRGLEITFIARGVPPLGYKAYYLLPAAAPDSFPQAATVQLDTEKDRRDTRRSLGEDVLENDYYRVNVDRATGRVSLFDKQLNRAVATDMEIAGVEERGGNYIGVEPLTGRTIPNSVRAIELEENTPVRAVLRIDGVVSDIPVSQRLTLYRELKRLDIENRVVWKEPRLVRLVQTMPTGRPAMSLHYGVPFGASGTEDILPNSGTHLPDEITNEAWKRVRHVQDWFHAGAEDGGLTVATDHPLISFDGSTIRAEMIRGARFSSTRIVRDGQVFSHHYPPSDTYVFRYSLSSGKGNWRDAKAYRSGMDFNAPLLAVSVSNRISSKPLPPSLSFCKLEGDHLVVSALKKADAGRGLVLRFYEMEGRAPSETSVEMLGRRAQIRAVNVLEESLESKPGQTLRVGPHEIKSVQFEMEKEAK